MKGVEEPVEICEVGAANSAALTPPPSSEKARRVVSSDSETVLGWRPAAGQVVPQTRWVLKERLREGGFGEVWLGEHSELGDRRVFKFCFRADRVRSLKRELALFRILKEKVGNHPNIVGIQEVFFDEPPFYLMMDYAEGADLEIWCERQGGISNVPLEIRLEIVAQVSDALAAAHQAGIIHQDVKPSNIIVSGQAGDLSSIRVKLTDFGIGQVVSGEHLSAAISGTTQLLQPSALAAGSGTVRYLPPELLSGRAASTRGDIYSLGVVCYELLVEDFSRPVTHEWPNGVPNASLRSDLSRALATIPLDRWNSVAEFGASLRNLKARTQAWENEALAVQTLGEMRSALAGRSKAMFLARMVLSATLLTALVLVGFVAFWISILIPHFLKSRVIIQGNQCRLQLAYLDAHSTEIQTRQKRGSAEVITPLFCPSGGTYIKKPDDGRITCSISGHVTGMNVYPPAFTLGTIGPAPGMGNVLRSYSWGMAIIGVVASLFGVCLNRYLTNRLLSTKTGY